MTTLRFEPTWEDPKQAQGAELAATWASLRILVDGEDVLELADLGVARALRSHVVLPLYPLAEWVATNWWALLSEVECPGAERELGSSLRHDAAFGAEGYAFPHLRMVSSGASALVEVRPRDLVRTHNLRFLGDRAVALPRRELERALAEFVGVVVRRLDAQGVAGTLLHQEWRALGGLTESERGFCSAVAALGLDPFDVADDVASHVREVGALLPDSLLDEFLSSVDERFLVGEAQRVRRAMTSMASFEGEATAVRDLQAQLRRGAGQAVPRSDVTPWSRGYELARLLRTTLGVDEMRLLSSWDDVGACLRTPSLRVSVMVGSVDRTVSGIQGIVGANQAGCIAVVQESGLREESQRFHLCRGLFEYLFGETSPRLLTRAHSDAQKQSRAFAAEFLVPAKALAARVAPRTSLCLSDIDDLAATCGVSPFVVHHQIENHHLARIEP